MPTFEMEIPVPILVEYDNVDGHGDGFNDEKVPPHVLIDKVSIIATVMQIENDNAEEIYAAAVEDAKLRLEFKRGRKRG